jgi:hypothetical protein
MFNANVITVVKAIKAARALNCALLLASGGCCAFLGKVIKVIMILRAGFDHLGHS